MHTGQKILFSCFVALLAIAITCLHFSNVRQGEAIYVAGFFFSLLAAAASLLLMYILTRSGCGRKRRKAKKRYEKNARVALGFIQSRL